MSLRALMRSRFCLTAWQFCCRSAANAWPSAALICFSFSIARLVISKTIPFMLWAFCSSGSVATKMPGKFSKAETSIEHWACVDEVAFLSRSITDCKAFSSISKRFSAETSFTRSTKLTIPRERFRRMSLSILSSRNAKDSGSLILILK